MSNTVLLGQSVSLLLTENGALQETLTDVTSFAFTSKFRILEMGYIGEKTKRHTFVFEGVSGDFELHIHRANYFLYLGDVKSKAQRVNPALQFAAQGLFAFDGGDVGELTVPDMSFGEFAHSAKSNGDFFDVKMPFAADDFETAVVLTQPGGAPA